MLHLETVSTELFDSLNKLMNCPVFSNFRLVGGTGLSLLLGHRVSIDIDLFTDIEYGTLDTHEISKSLQKIFPYIDGLEKLNKRNIGYTLYCGKDKDNAIKLDLYYTDKFCFKPTIIDNIRIADIRDIAAMKIIAINNSNRKKDYWDIYELMNHYSLSQMIGFAEQRSPFEIERKDLLNKLRNIPVSEIDNIPIKALKDHYWEFIVEDIEEEARAILNND